MSSLLDTLGALVLGSLFILTVYNATFNVQATAYDSRQQITLTKVTEEVVDALDDHYLNQVGAGVANNQIIIAEPSRFKFRGIFPDDTSEIVSVEIVAGEFVDEKGYPLRVYRDDILEMGPFWLAESLKLTYYDRNEEETTDRTQIHSVKVEMEMFYDSFSQESGSSVLKNKIVFWEYFKNLYLQ